MKEREFYLNRLNEIYELQHELRLDVAQNKRIRNRLLFQKNKKTSDLNVQALQVMIEGAEKNIIELDRHIKELNRMIRKAK